MITTLKTLVHFDMSNKTNVKISNSICLVFENQSFYKNGKPKGKGWESQEYYFFDNPENYETFMAEHKNTPKTLSRVNLVVVDGSKYDTQFLLKNLNK